MVTLTRFGKLVEMHSLEVRIADTFPLREGINVP